MNISENVIYEGFFWYMIIKFRLFCILDRQTIISPVILCGPGQPGVLKKACILSFQHCANMRLGGWMLSLCGSDTSPDEPPRWHVSHKVILMLNCYLLF